MRDDGPVFEPLRNSNLVCVNCVLKDDNDFNVVGCAAYDIKPGTVFDGAECPKHLTLEEAVARYKKNHPDA